MCKTSKQRKLYDFLVKKHKLHEEFQLSEVVLSTGYRLSPIKTYINKKLSGYLLKKQSKGYFVNDEILKLTFDKFINHMSLHC